MTIAESGHRAFANAAVGAALETVLTQTVAGSHTAFFTYTVTDAAFDQFSVQYQAHTDGIWEAVADAAGDFTTPTYPVLMADSDLTISTVAAHNLQIDTTGIFAVRVQAASGTTSGVTGHMSWGA